MYSVKNEPANKLLNQPPIEVTSGFNALGKACFQSTFFVLKPFAFAVCMKSNFNVSAILFLANCIKTATGLKPRAKAGKIRFSGFHIKRDPSALNSLQLPVMGSPVYLFQTNPNNHDNNIAEKNDGTEIPNVEKATIDLSTKPPSLRAANTPRGIPITTAISIAAKARIMVPMNASDNISLTSRLV